MTQARLRSRAHVLIDSVSIVYACPVVITPCSPTGFPVESSKGSHFSTGPWPLLQDRVHDLQMRVGAHQPVHTYQRNSLCNEIWGSLLLYWNPGVTCTLKEMPLDLVSVLDVPVDVATESENSLLIEVLTVAVGPDIIQPTVASTVTPKLLV
jgi:hypothetical protein